MRLVIPLSLILLLLLTAVLLSDSGGRKARVEVPEHEPYSDAEAEALHSGEGPHEGPEVMIHHLSSVNWPYGPQLPTEILQAIEDAKQLRPDESSQQGAKESTLLIQPWEYAGAKGMSVRGKSDLYTGRINDIRSLPGGKLLVLAANGGLWKESDVGWIPIADTLPVTGMGSCDFDPIHPDTIIIGTGDPAPGRNGLGIYRTVDGGANWTRQATATVGGQFSRLRFAPVWWEDGLVFAASDSGLVKSVNNGASWVVKKRGDCRSFDFAYDPFAPTERVMYAGFAGREDMSTLPPGYPYGGLFRSEDAGETWTRVPSPELPDSTVTHNVEVDVCDGSPDNVWVLYSIIQSDGSIKVDKLKRSIDGGATWSDVGLPGGIDDYEGWYVHLLAVHPSNPNRVLVGGIKLHYTPSGGAFTGALPVHDDQHVALWVGPDELYVGNDGGLWHSTDSGGTWSTSKNTLPITQYEDFSVCFYDPRVAAGGTQDNGLSRTHDVYHWEVFDEGDGGGIAFNPLNCLQAIAVDGFHGMGSPFTRVKTEDGFDSQGGFEGGIPGNNDWAPSVRWPRYGDGMYTAAGSNVYFTPSLGDNWVPLNATPFSAPVLNIAVTDLSEAVYVTLDKSTTGGRVWAYRDGTWYDRDHGLPSGTRLVRVKPDPTRGAFGVAYLICQNAGATNQQVWKTVNFGATWDNISLTMDACIPTDVTSHPDDPNQIYVSHTTGMLWTPNNGTTWLDANTNLPSAIEIDDIYIVPDPAGALGEYWLYAGTYGRGIWRRKITAPPAGPPDPTKSIARRYGSIDVAGGGHILAHPDGSGPTLASAIAGVAVQVLDSNLQPVAGLDPSRVTLHSYSAYPNVECATIEADAPTDRAGWTSFTGAFPWGGYTPWLSVHIDGTEISPAMRTDVVSTDINQDLRVDIADLERFVLDLGTTSASADFDGNGIVADADTAILRTAILEPKSCPFQPPTMAAPQAVLGVYFDEAATQFGRIADAGDTLTLYVVARDLPADIRGIEFALPNLLHPSIEVLDTQWAPTVVSPQITSGDEFMAIFDPCPPAGPLVTIATITCRLNAWVGALGFMPVALSAPSFGTPTIPGDPGWLECSDGVPKHPFKLFETASINPFPLAVYWGLQHQALGSASLLPQGRSLVLSGLNDPSGGGARAYFDAARPPGSAPISEATITPLGVDGAAFGFGAPLAAANLPEGATVGLAWNDHQLTPLVEYDGTVTNGQWAVHADMTGAGSATMHLQALLNDQLVFEDTDFGGDWLAEMVLPEAQGLLYEQGEFQLNEFWASPINVTIGGNSLQIDQLVLGSQTQGGVPGLAVGSASVSGSLLPDITLTREGIQRFGQIYVDADNVIVSSEASGLRLLLESAPNPGTTNIESLGDNYVDVALAAPPADATQADVNMQFRGRGDPNAGVLDWGLQRVGSNTDMTLDVSGVGAAGWLARGYRGGIQQWEVSGSGLEVGLALAWPTRTHMGPSGLEVDWLLPTGITQGVPMASAGSLAPVDHLEIIPQQPQQPLPDGAQVTVSFSGVSEISFGEPSATTGVDPTRHRITPALYPNSPNPFTPLTTIRYDIGRQGGHVSLKVYDAEGRLVRTLVDGWEIGGEKRIVWDARDNRGVRAASGVYYYRLQAPGIDSARMMVLVR